MRVLIVDDEPLARLRLRRLLEAEADVEIAECDGGRAAITRVRRDPPDAIFLDVQMPEVDGFAVIAALGLERMPLTVFVTAFDQHAVRAFEACALDYLLKPFDDERFARSLARIRDRLAGRSDTAPAAFVVRDMGAVRLVPAAEVEWIGAAGNYVALHIGGRSVLHREGLSAVEQRLPGLFVRAHRGVLVNRSAVREVRGTGHGDGVVVTAGGTDLPLSRRFRHGLLAAIGAAAGPARPTLLEP